MAVSYNQEFRTWQVNGRGSYASQEEAAAADGGGAPAASPTSPTTFTGTAGTGVGGAAPSPTAVKAPAAPVQPVAAEGMGIDAVRARATATAQRNEQYQVTRGQVNSDTLAQSNASAGGPGYLPGYGGAQPLNQAWGAPRPGTGIRDVNTSPEQLPGPGGAPAPGAGVTSGTPPGFATFDRSGYDQRQADLDTARNTFMGELDRLSGVDPFGNQAFLQKATDRGVAQASGTAAMARGGAAAQAGANRTAQGVQSQASARGAQEMEQVRAQDEVQSGALRGQAAQGLAGLGTQRAQLDLEVAAKETETMTNNLQQWIAYKGIELPLNQSNIENLRNAAVELKGLEVQLRGQDIGMREGELNRIMQKYGIDAGTQTALKQIAAGENVSTDEFIMGLLGAGAGVAGAVMGSDRRFKEEIRDPDLRDLQDFLGNTRGKLYRYKDPGKPGRRDGLNFGPMAQDLAKSKIGRTVVVDGPDGMYVDTGRLALADHAALAELARDVARLKARK